MRFGGRRFGRLRRENGDLTCVVYVDFFNSTTRALSKGVIFVDKTDRDGLCETIQPRDECKNTLYSNSKYILSIWQILGI